MRRWPLTKHLRSARGVGRVPSADARRGCAPPDYVWNYLLTSDHLAALIERRYPHTSA